MKPPKAPTAPSAVVTVLHWHLEVFCLGQANGETTKAAEIRVHVDRDDGSKLLGAAAVQALHGRHGGRCTVRASIITKIMLPYSEYSYTIRCLKQT